MTRRYKPTMINASREDTRQAEMFRERTKPVPTPATPEATPAPTAQPKPGRGKNVKVRLDEPYYRRQAASTVAEGLARSTRLDDDQIVARVQQTLSHERRRNR